METDAGPERVNEVFLLVADDSSVQIEHHKSDGTVENITRDAAEPLPNFSHAPADFEAAAPRATTTGGSPQMIPTPAAITPEGATLAAGLPTVPAVNGSSRPPTQMSGLSPFPGARPHARIRVDANQLDDLVGLAGELAGAFRQPPGPARESPRRPLAPALEGPRAGQPADPGHDARPAHGARRRTLLAVHRVVRDLADQSARRSS